MTSYVHHRNPLSTRIMQLASILIILLSWLPGTASAQDTVDLPIHEEWDTYSATSARNVGGWLFCKSGINDQSIVQRSDLHAYLTSGSTPGSGTVVATPYLNQVADTFSFRLYGSNLHGQTAQVEFGYIPDTPPLTAPSDICNLFVPYDTVPLSVSNQWQRTTVDLHPYYAIHGTAHRLAIRLLNSFNQELYLDEVGAWKDGSAPCNPHTTAADDFWITFIPNGELSQTRFSVIATGLTDATISIQNPLTGWSTTTSHTGGTKTYIQLPDVSTIPSATANTMGYHITATADISLYASNYRVDSWDICHILPSSRLTSHYIVQDYPNNSDFPGALALVATEDNTVLTMTIPCTIENLSLPVGSTYTITLNAGQTLALKCSLNQGFSGMSVTSNEKPFALFQGHSCARVGTTDNQRGRDHLMEQAIPLDWWGSEFVVVSEQGRTEGDRIRITASADNTQVQIDEASNSQSITLNAGQTHEYQLPSNSAARITSSGPVYVCKYLVSFDKFNPTSLGDPASVDIPPIHNWLCGTTFPVHNCNNDPSSEQYITANHHYLDIVTTAAAAPDMMLDGQPLPASQFTPLAGTPYAFYHGLATIGAHTLHNDSGPFYATVSGHARWVAYAFLTGMGLDAEEDPVPPQIIHDTLHYHDTLCQGQDYTLPSTLVIGTTTYTLPFEGLIHLRPDETATPGDLERWSSWVEDDTLVHHICLTLTILPDKNTSLNESLIAGDTLFFADTAITLAGDYTFRFTAANGCDSVVTLHVGYQPVALSASAEGLCPGEEVVLSASGTHTVLWRAVPPDPALDSLQGQNPIGVRPRQTTTYSLIDAAGNTIASITVGVEPPPTLCIESNRSYIDFDHPVLMLHDCSSDRHHTSWLFSDGAHFSGERVRRQLLHPLPDSLSVLMTTCNRYNCCTDTTVSFATEILSVWFPNIFFPDRDNNNRFGCVTSRQVVDFELVVFNRWGLEVWSTNDVGAAWDGTHDGQPVKQDAYVYKWYLKDIHREVCTGTGTVTLIR